MRSRKLYLRQTEAMTAKEMQSIARRTHVIRSIGLTLDIKTPAAEKTRAPFFLSIQRFSPFIRA